MSNLDLPDGSESIPFELELQGAPDEIKGDFFSAFDSEEEEVLFSHSFGGVSSLVVAAKLTASAITKLVELLNKIKLPKAKTILRISDKSFTLETSSGDDLLKIIKSPELKELIDTTSQNARRKQD